MANQLLPDRWPDDSLEGQMLQDAELVSDNANEGSAAADLCCHVRALLERVRALESERQQKKDALVSLVRDLIAVCQYAAGSFTQVPSTQTVPPIVLHDCKDRLDAAWRKAAETVEVTEA